MGWVAHLIHSLHVQLLDKTAAKVAQLIKTIFAMVTTSSTIPCYNNTINPLPVYWYIFTTDLEKHENE